jgi:hypothetical protein
MAAGNYEDFARSRRIDISPQATIDLTTGAITGQSFVYLSESAGLADDNYRDLYKTRESVYVLRIPADCVDRQQLQDTLKSGVWQYRRSMTIPHCGVERIEIDAARLL